MNNSFEKMQKLAFGKVLLKENINESLNDRIFDSLDGTRKIYFSPTNAGKIEYAVVEKDIDGSFDEPYFRELDLEWLDAEAEAMGEDFNKYFDKLKSPKLNESDSFKSKIREMIKTSLSEKKKGKKDVEVKIEDEEVIDTPTDVIEPTASAEVSPEVKSVQDHLQAAYNEAKALGDEKLVAQIGNSITYFTRTQVLGNKEMNENDHPNIDFNENMAMLVNELMEVINIAEENAGFTTDELIQDLDQVKAGLEEQPKL